ncbi:MAG TPA: hypothetical protein VMZ71_01190, partial [Gemmataceae bacterium]|nr:hypothetical protein [Gemmataceae bacterium]
MGVRLVIYTGLLFASWYFNGNGIPDGQAWGRTEPRTGYLGSESHLVLGRLARPDAGPLHPLCERLPDGSFQDYRSQFGLTGVALAPLRSASGVEPAAFAAVFALLTALVMAAVFAVAHRVLGPPTGDVACAYAVSVPIFLSFAPSLYWATFLLLAPFAAVWCLLPRAASGSRRAGLLGLVTVLVAAKSLCGYEYITTVILAPVAAAWFHQHRKAEPVRARVLFAGGLCVAGVAGFALAVVIHAAQLRAVFGEDGFAVIRERAAARTTGNPVAEMG